jgi:hypothetical protein
VSRPELLPKVTAGEDGQTVYVCLQGHAHEFQSVAIACNLEYDALVLDVPPLPQRGVA